MLKLPIQHQQYIQYLENQQESQTKALNFGIATAVGELKMDQQDYTTADLLKQCSETLDLVTKQWSLMQGQELTIQPLFISCSFFRERNCSSQGNEGRVEAS